MLNLTKKFIQLKSVRPNIGYTKAGLKMINDKFYKNSAIVTLANLLTGMLAFIFSIILSRKIGTEGMGLYGLIMPIYSLAICIVAEGLITAISKITAGYFSKNDFTNLKRTISVTAFFILIWAIFISFMLYLLSGFLSSKVINDARTVYALRILCPAVIIIPISAIFKGYFYGSGKFYVTSLIDICEKAFRVTILLFAIVILSSDNLQETVTSAFAAVALGEFLSFFILLFSYFKNSRNEGSTQNIQNKPQLLFNVLAISLPLCLNGILSSILSTASSLILPRRLASTGITYAAALSLIGKFSGMALNITFFPMVIVGSMSTVLVPDISTNITMRDFRSVKKRVRQVFSIAAMVGISTVIMNLIIPDELGMLVYKRDDLGSYIKFAAICSLLTYISIPTYGILNGLGKQKVILMNSLTVSVMEVILIYILSAIPGINIYGLGITLVITSVTALIINMRELKKTLEIQLPFLNFLKSLIIGVITFFTVKFISGLLPQNDLSFKCITVILLTYLLPFIIWRIRNPLKPKAT